jgi:hypothetical protein
LFGLNTGGKQDSYPIHTAFGQLAFL